MPNLVSLTKDVRVTCPSLQILGKTQTVVFQVSEFLKLGLAMKLDKGNETTSKKIDDDVISRNCGVIVIFPIYGKFVATRKPDTGRIVCKTYIFINSYLLSYKN